MQQKFADRIDVIDIDTRICAPEDLWTSRVSKKWGIDEDVLFGSI